MARSFFCAIPPTFLHLGAAIPPDALRSLVCSMRGTRLHTRRGGEVSNARIGITLSEEEHTALQRIARSHERSVSGEVRYVLRQRIRAAKQDASKWDQEGGAA